MDFISQKKEVATTNIEQPTHSLSVPFKMNMMSTVEEMISNDENSNNKRQKTSSDSFDKKNDILERGSVRRKAKTDHQLFINKNDCINHHDSTTQAVEKQSTSTFFKCSKCDYVTGKQLLLNRHTGDSHDGIKCRKCNASFKCRSMLIRHYFFDCIQHKFYSMMKDYCSTCQKPMPTLREASICVKCNSVTRLQCAKCETMCCSNTYAYKHFRFCYKDIALCCNDCDYKTYLKAELRQHIKSEHMEKMYPCTNCSERCDSNAALARHRIVIHNAPRRKFLLQYCPSCEYSLATASKKKAACLECETTLEHQCVFCYSRFPNYNTGYRHVTLYCKDPDSYSCKRYKATDLTDSKMNNNSVRKKINNTAQYSNIQSEPDSFCNNYENIQTKKESVLNIRLSDTQSGISHEQTKDRNIPSVQPYKVKNYDNVDIQKETSVKNYDVPIGPIVSNDLKAAEKFTHCSSEKENLPMPVTSSENVAIRKPGKMLNAVMQKAKLLCTDCGKNVPLELIKRKRLQPLCPCANKEKKISGAAIFVCLACEKIFECLDYIYFHFKHSCTEASEKYQCPKCSHYAKVKSRLNEHIINKHR